MPYPQNLKSKRKVAQASGVLPCATDFVKIDARKLIKKPTGRSCVEEKSKLFLVNPVINRVSPDLFRNFLP